MPKERLHLLIADESLRALNRAGRMTSVVGDLKSAFLLGAISPDVLFYDFPRFSLNRVGAELHQLEGKASIAFFKDWLREKGDQVSARTQAWVLGMVSHFMTDALWHPFINELSGSTTGFCNDSKLSPKNCHHWLESELEALWLERMGDADAYIPFLGSIMKKRELIATRAGLYEEILLRLGIRRAPADSRIKRCFYWQNFFLRQFYHPIWIHQRQRLLARDSTRFLGALIAPQKPGLPELLSSKLINDRAATTLCAEKHMEETISLLSNLLTELPTQL